MDQPSDQPPDQPPDQPRLLVVGDGPVTDSLAALGALLEWPTTVAAALPEATAAMSDADVVVVTSHHDNVDAPAIAAALAAAPAYLGAMGSRARQERRRAWLLEQGLTDEALAAVRGPAGLDIGADTPGEIALAILAEAVAVLRGREAAGSLSDRDGPLHPDLAPGEASCPPG